MFNDNVPFVGDAEYIFFKYYYISRQATSIGNCVRCLLIADIINFDFTVDFDYVLDPVNNFSV